MRLDREGVPRTFEIPRLKGEIGDGNAFFLEVVGEENLDSVLEQMTSNIRAKVGDHAPEPRPKKAPIIRRQCNRNSHRYLQRCARFW